MENLFQRLIELSEKCRQIHGRHAGEFSVNYNPHLSCYETPSHYMLEKDEIELLEKCDNENRLVTIDFSTICPVGHFSIFDTNFDDAARRMIEAVEGELDLDDSARRMIEAVEMALKNEQ